jgi:hypothetical protein
VLAGVALTLALAAPSVLAQGRITTPRQQLGFNIGDDYHLVTYTQLEAYWQKLDRESPRMVLEEIGRTAEDRPHYMAIITSPENHANLARYKEIITRLSLAEGLSDSQARELAKEGKAVVWIDGGLHGTEVVGAHQLMETVFQLVSANDEETMRFLDDVIVLAVHANPDGMELVSSWYMRESDPTKRSSRGIPRLYQKYIGHDNNRDFYMVAQPETENLSRIMFREWFPQIVYNHHQSGPAGTVLFAPPFRDPFNYNFDPLVPLGIEAVGAAMHQRFVAEGKPGSTMRHGASYSTWWNGGLRTTTYFHNQIGLLTEIIGNPTPQAIPFLPDRQLASNDLPSPIQPQEWHFRQSIDYSVTANKAVIDYASRYRETMLYNTYLMGKRNIEKGSRDNWTVHPKLINEVKMAVRRDGGVVPTGRRSSGVPTEYFGMLREPELRDPRGYILPSDQSDFPTATKFVNALIKSGITIHRATRNFQVAGKRYPSGSYVIKTAQAFRPHVVDLFEPQDHPNDFQYPGGPPIPPYDNAGWTLAYLMDVEFDRILDGFDGPFEEIEGFAEAPAGTVASASGAAGFLLSHEMNDAFIAMNRLFANRQEVYWLSEQYTVDGRTWPAGTMYIPAESGTRRMLQGMASELGLSFEGVQTPPPGDAMRMRSVRIGLWDRYGGSMPSGWTRWLLEQFEFDYELVYPQDLDAGNLNSKYDVLVFATGAIPAPPTGEEDEFARFRGGPPDPASIPEEYRGWLGDVTLDETVPQLKRFLEDGGTMITIGSSTNMAYHAGVPVENYLVDHEGRQLSRDVYYMPGSVHRIRVDNTQPLAWGLGEHVDVFFNNSPVFKLRPGAEAQGVKRIGWFDSKEPLRSGWAWGQHYLAAGTTVAEAAVGSGKLFLLGPEILNRGQPHGSFKLFFNGVFLAGATPVAMQAAGGN